MTKQRARSESKALKAAGLEIGRLTEELRMNRRDLEQSAEIIRQLRADAARHETRVSRIGRLWQRAMDRMARP